MNRRDFLKWMVAGGAVIGIGTGVSRYLRTPCPVWIHRVADYGADVHRILATTLAADGIELRGKKVLLKPNFVEVHPGRPINTDLRFIQQVAEACFLSGASEVWVGEAAGHRQDPFYSVHHPSLAQVLDKRIRRFDMNFGPVVTVPNRGSYTRLPSFHLPVPVMEADVIINLPKMKTHHWAGVTLSLKNLFGTLPGVIYGWPKNLLHVRGIYHSILDLALTVPVHYVMVDGIVGMEGDGPIMGIPKPMGLVIMGRYPLAVDCTAARLMGFDPERVPYLNQASRHFPGFYESSTVYRAEHPRSHAAKFQCVESFKPWQRDGMWS